MPQLDGMPRYWASDKPRHEVDYLIQLGNSIVPCEVKAGTNVKSPSLKYYSNKYAESRLCACASRCGISPRTGAC